MKLLIISAIFILAMAKSHVYPGFEPTKCMEEASHICPQQGERAVMNCLKAKATQLSPSCRKSIEQYTKENRNGY